MPMSNPNDQHEPSMEEILASIRQIISEDGEEAPDGEPQKRRATDREQASGPLDLTQVVNEDGSVTDLNGAAPDGGSVQAGEAEPLEAFGEPAAPSFSEESSEEPAVEPQPEPNPDVETSSYPGLPAEELVSPDRAGAVQSALGRLSSETRVRGAADPASLEGLVTEMLRPMLKVWLDENLPRIVERAVREEIDRISKRAG
jgi:cell pole-organizing protein PopZ